MYSRFVFVLKFLQILGYVVVVLYAIAFYRQSGVGSLIIAGILCFWNYIATQVPIAIVDILNRIEINTRNLRRD